jgi:pSer/pThr/pTyr-binding forkhead associated (FHA) protein
MDVHLITRRIQTSESRPDYEKDTDRLLHPPQAPLQSWISLHLIESSQILPLADRTEFTLGRSAEGQPIVPDVDLTSYNAYANGVSRLHAAIKLVNNRIVVVDLGSSNGTYLNGIRLSPYIETPVSHGDLIYLGKLKIEVLIDLES